MPLLCASTPRAGGGRLDAESETLIPTTGGGFDVAHALTGEGFDASEDGTGRGTPIVPVQPYTLAIRGRGDSHDLEYRQDGTANALLTPNGGRGGIGVGAIAHAFDARQSDVIQYGDKTGPLDTDGHSVAIAFSCKDHGADAGPISPTLRSMNHDGSHANGGGQVAVAFHENQRAEVSINDTAGALNKGGGKPGQGYPAVMQAMQVRRLTPVECERLQGFPDGYTDIRLNGKQTPDGSRYKALGNSMAVPVMAWIGQRIQMVEEVCATAKSA